MGEVKMDVYVTEDCWACQETRRIVADIAPRFPNVEINLRNLDDQQTPGHVFATPTYLLNGRTIYLGNPTRDQLIETLIAAQDG